MRCSDVVMSILAQMTISNVCLKTQNRTSKISTFLNYVQKRANREPGINKLLHIFDFCILLIIRSWWAHGSCNEKGCCGSLMLYITLVIYFIMHSCINTFSFRSTQRNSLTLGIRLLNHSHMVRMCVCVV